MQSAVHLDEAQPHVRVIRSAMSQRCPWARNELAIRYHDEEWGVPQRDPRVLFEFLILEGAQAGLSWDTILAKRDRYREVFDGFDAGKIAAYGPRKVASLLRDPGIVRNRLKIAAAITNARAWLTLEQECKERGGVAGARKAAGENAGAAAYLWQFVQGRPIVNAWTDRSQVPATSPASDELSKDLKRRGFKFVGSTICYALMQATGMVNDHLVTCPRHGACRDHGASAV